jgi:hypothetical protein
LEQYRRYDVLRQQTEPRRAAARARALQYRVDHPDRYQAHTLVGNAVRDGRLIKLPCAVCGTTVHVHAHHDDYTRPLDVRWLCAEHHSAAHRE